MTKKKKAEVLIPKKIVDEIIESAKAQKLIREFYKQSSKMIIKKEFNPSRRLNND